MAALHTDYDLRPLRERARAIFEPAIEARLREAGYRVIPVRVADSVWIARRDSVGGFYDPMTGRVVESRLDSVWRGTRDDLARRFGAGAWVHIQLVSVSPGFSGDRAQWHGTSEATGGRGGLAGLLIGRTAGTLAAISLQVTLEDTRDGNTLERRAGGIQLRSKIVEGGLEELPFDRLLRDDERNAAAVRMAVDSIAARWPPR